jgi:hypothetical protein
MTVSGSLNSGDPILPATPYEWRENIEYVATITLCFIAAHAIARALYMRLAARKALMR